MIVRGYHAHQSKWVAVGKNRVSYVYDSFAVAVTKGKLVTGHKNLLQFTQCFDNKEGQFSVELPDLRLNNNCAWLP